jgi:hypothetical protein
MNKEILSNEKLVESGKLVIRKEETRLLIKNYRKATKPGTSGHCGWGWGMLYKVDSIEGLNELWDELIEKGAVEG